MSGAASAAPAGAEGGFGAVGLGKQYDGVTVARNIHIAVRPGEAVGLFGRSGSGKSTIFGMMAGTLGPDAGRVVLDGADIGGLDVDKRARLGVGYIPQAPELFSELTVADNLRIAIEERVRGRTARRAAIDALIEAYGLGRWRDRRLSALSGGERRQCEIAFVMSTRPRFMLLDEPFTGLDPIVSETVRRRIARMTQAGIGVLVTDHKVREALTLVDRAYIIDDGEIIAEGRPAELTANDRVRAVYLGFGF
ncbi:MAG: LPS export ABC transporter ATP-binding protein [Rhizobiales bacterium]|nr:LPS export ABC transporter ATP-binding protein [Hyphomicrobiales bacterium]